MMKRMLFLLLPLCFIYFSCAQEAKSSYKACVTNPSSDKKSTHKSEIIEIIKKVNDYWQSNNSQHENAFWHRAAYHTGNLAVYEVTGIEKYKEYSEAWAEKNEWSGAKSESKSEWKYKPYGEGQEYVLFGDWQTCFQVYLDLYKYAPDERKIARTKEVIEYQVSTSEVDYWWWADGLYMMMPVMTKMYKLTGDEIYLDKLYTYFSYAKNLMYDEDAGLFYRDAKYIYPKHKTKDGLKDFWARGNGWVFAAFAKVLNEVPSNHPHRNEYVEIYKKMAKVLAESQQEEGYWSRSMLDLNHAPGRETSGTAFFVYGLLWGVNNGVISEEQYLPVINKGWRYLTEIALQPSGKVGYVQPIGERADQHKDVGPETTADFGVGAFLLAASEMVKCLR